MVEYLDPEIANEGQSANDWKPGMAWTNTPAQSDEEWQPEMDPPPINDYAAFKKHKHYGRYFRPYRYQAFPAWLYHPTAEPKLIDIRFRDGTVDQEECKKAALRLGEKWRREPYPKDQHQSKNMTGKSHPSKSDTQRLTEALVAGFADKQGGAVDPNMIAAIVAATVAALNRPVPVPSAPQAASESLLDATATEPGAEEEIERKALLELAEQNNVKIDGRWNNARIRKELGL